MTWLRTIGENMKNRVQRSLPVIQELLGVSDWKVKVVQSDTPSDGERDTKYEEQTQADVDCDPDYLKCTLTIYPKFKKRIEEDAENFLDTVIHEMVHVVLSSYDHLLDKVTPETENYYVTRIQETATERLTRAIRRALTDEKLRKKLLSL